MSPTNSSVELLSVNVSLPKLVPFGRSAIKTGIFKQPVNGPVAVRTMNLDGDRQADLEVHGGVDKAIYVYSHRNIEYWRQALGRDDLGPGTFGENFTVSHLSDDAVSIGDQLKIGTALFEVTQPRLPCYKLGIALGRVDFPKLFHREDRHGFYLRVLREGTVQAGDRILWTPAPQSITIAAFVEIYRRRRIGSEDVARIEKLRALPEAWKLWLTRRVSLAEESQLAP